MRRKSFAISISNQTPQSERDLTLGFQQRFVAIGLGMSLERKSSPFWDTQNGKEGKPNLGSHFRAIRGHGEVLIRSDSRELEELG